MPTDRFEVLEWAACGTHLLEKARTTLSTAPTDRARALADRVPSALLEPDSRLSVVFAGQYSAGKSTIIRALTDRDDIVAGAGITTDTARTYEWDGVELVDTPGVHTEIRPDHDAVTYQAIADADLVVFVVTNELFDSHLAQHFRKLAIERDKAHEMMLVVNKMRRCAKGNSPETQDIIREDLRRVLVPFAPEDLRTTFIDAEAALASKSEQEEAISRSLWVKSGLEGFIKELNSFVRDNHLTAKYTTALYNLEQIMQEALAVEPSGDADVDALEELLLQRRRALVETEQRIPRAVERQLQRSGTLVRQEGRKVADLIHGKANPKEVDRELRAAQERVEGYAEQLAAAVQEVIGRHSKELGERVGAIAESELARELLLRLGERFEEHTASATISPEAAARLKKAGDMSRQLGEFLVRNSFSSKAASFAGLFRLKQYSGTATHGAVKAVGRFFGKSFKPWQAVKWTRAIANAGRALAVVGTVLTFILQVKEDQDAVRAERDLRESRAAIRSGFNDAARAIETHYGEATSAYVASTLTEEIKAVDAQLVELRAMQQARSQLFQDLTGLLQATRALIRELHCETS